MLPHKKEGFESWLSGMTGWYYSDGVNKWGQTMVARLNDLQQVVKEYAPPDLLYCFPGKSRILLWLNRNDLWRCVIDVRFFVERAKKKLPNTDSGRRLKRCLTQNSYDGPDCLVHWAHHDPVSLLALYALHITCFFLSVWCLTNSGFLLASLQQNSYPLTVVTEESMRRLVELLVELLIYVLPRKAEEKLNGIMAKLNGGNKQGKK